MTIKIQATLVSGRVNLRPFTQKLKKQLSKLHKESVRRWLEVVLTETPVYTGTVRGTFKPVGRLVGRAVSRMGPVNARASSKTHFIYPKGGKKVPLGFNRGEDYADAELTEVDTGISIEYTFTFIRDLIYALWNDIQPAPNWLHLKKQTPWKALDKASAAWEIFVREDVFKALPPLTHSLKFTVIKVR